MDLHAAEAHSQPAETSTGDRLTTSPDSCNPPAVEGTVSQQASPQQGEQCDVAASHEDGDTEPRAVSADPKEPLDVAESAPDDTDRDDSGEVPVALVTVDGPKGIERKALTEFVGNAALQDVKGQLEACHAAGVKPPRFPLCGCTFPHNVLACSALHLQSEVLRIGKFETVRIRGLVENPGLQRLLAEPSGRHIMCSSAKAHSAETCKHLHRDPRTVVVGRERHGYLPEEFVDNQALRHLVSHPEHSGRWCTNPQKHEPKTCQFLHRAPPIGVTVGRRNQNLTKEGKVVVSSRPIFDKKKVVNGRVVREADVPEAIWQQQAELELAVAAAQSSEAGSAAEASGAESTSGSTQDATSPVASRSPTLFGVHPALVLVAIAVVLAFLIPVIFPE